MGLRFKSCFKLSVVKFSCMIEQATDNLLIEGLGLYRMTSKIFLGFPHFLHFEICLSYGIDMALIPECMNRGKLRKIFEAQGGPFD